MLEFFVKMTGVLILGFILLSVSFFFAFEDVVAEEQQNPLVIKDAPVETPKEENLSISEQVESALEIPKPSESTDPIPMQNKKISDLEKSTHSEKRAYGTEIADPTIPFTQAPKSMSQGSTEIKSEKKRAEYTLTQIIIGHARKLAIINGEIVGEGQNIGDSSDVVLEITPDKVVLDTAAGKTELTMGGVSIRKPHSDKPVINKADLLSSPALKNGSQKADLPGGAPSIKQKAMTP